LKKGKKSNGGIPTLPRARARGGIKRRVKVRTSEIEEQILEAVRQGVSLITICDDPALPCRDTVFAWIAADEERKLAKQVAEGEVLFSDRFAIATHIRVKAMAEELLTIADDGRNDTYPDSEGRRVVDYDHIQRSKLRIDARKWIMSKLEPREYGDKPSEVHVNNSVHNHLHISSEELQRLQARRKELMERA
jgi:hypothetical protein